MKKFYAKYLNYCVINKIAWINSVSPSKMPIGMK